MLKDVQVETDNVAKTIVLRFEFKEELEKVDRLISEYKEVKDRGHEPNLSKAISLLLEFYDDICLDFGDQQKFRQKSSYYKKRIMRRIQFLHDKKPPNETAEVFDAAEKEALRWALDCVSRKESVREFIDEIFGNSVRW